MVCCRRTLNPSLPQRPSCPRHRSVARLAIRARAVVLFPATAKGWSMDRARRRCAVLLPACALLLAVAPRATEAQELKLQANLISFQEVPSLLSTGAGELTATVNPSRTSITFTLTYSG